MKPGRFPGRGLWWKLFLSHLVVVLVGMIAYAVTARIHAPVALDHTMAGMMSVSVASNPMLVDIQQSLAAAIGETLTVAGLVAALAAVTVSSIVAWRIISPVRVLLAASKRMAAGDYGDRLTVNRTDELGELARSFNRMAGALNDTETRRMELIGNVAHELRTPLASIRGIMEGLTDGVLPPDAETFQDVQREASRLERLTSELSELSKAESGAMELTFAPVQLADLCRTAAGRLVGQFADKDVALSLELEESLPMVHADGERVLQVLINLLGNALQYTDPGGTVTVHCTRDGAALRVAVRDTGVGLSDDDLPRVFERFYRVDKSRSRARGGSGIGLTIALHLVRAHGGTIEAKSDGPGLGSTFTVVLPVTES